MSITVIAEYHEAPAEGINVVSRTLIDDLRASGQFVRIVSPDRLLQNLPRLIFRPSRLTVFTHGPGVRTVLVCAIMRRVSRSRLVWIATRPDLSRLPKWLSGRSTAHAVICNRRRTDLHMTAPDAEVIIQPIGIAPERLAGGQSGRWPAIAAKGVPVAVHVGHLRRSRGLERLCEIKALLGDRIEVVVVASPYFEPAPGLMEELVAAGVHVDRGFVPTIADVYRSSDLYLFTPSPESEGAIELPLGVLEALSCSVPVISTRFGALPEFLEGANGVQFAASQDFAEAVATWVARGAANPRPDGLPDHLNAHQIARRVLDLYADVI
jgi:glycosyltransferase involved in cell wall biosynthesis